MVVIPLLLNCCTISNSTNRHRTFSDAETKSVAIEYLNNQVGVYLTRSGDSISASDLNVRTIFKSTCLSIREVHPNSNWPLDYSVSIFSSNSGDASQSFLMEVEQSENLYDDFERLKAWLVEQRNNCSKTYFIWEYFIKNVKNLEYIDSLNFQAVDSASFKARVFNFKERVGSLSYHEQKLTSAELQKLWVKLDSSINTRVYKDSLEIFAGRGMEYIFFLKPVKHQEQPLFIWYRPTLFAFRNEPTNLTIRIL